MSDPGESNEPAADEQGVSPPSSPPAAAEDTPPASPSAPTASSARPSSTGRRKIGRPAGCSTAAEPSGSLSLGKQGDLVLYVLDPVRDRGIISLCKSVPAHTRVVAKDRLPKARFRQLDPFDAYGGLQLKPYNRPCHYDHSLISSVMDDLWSYVAYDLDEEDEQWLTEYNSRFTPSGSTAAAATSGASSDKGDAGAGAATATPTPKLTEDGFELIIDRLEKFAFRCDRNAESTMKQMAVDQSDDVCAVCGDGMSEDANQIIYCDGCDIAVHQQCYGVPYIPEGSWKCERCLSDTPAECVLCHDRTRLQALRRTTTGEWVHIHCAIWAPHSKLTFVQGPGEIEYLDTIDISGITQSDRQTVCYLCNEPGGVCTHCCQPGCSRGFHATCGRSAKLHMRCSIPEVFKENALFDKEKCRMTSAPPAPCSFAKYRSWCAEHKPIGRPPGRRKSTALTVSAGSGDEDEKAIVTEKKESETVAPPVSPPKTPTPEPEDHKTEKKKKTKKKQVTLLDLPGALISEDKADKQQSENKEKTVTVKPDTQPTEKKEPAPEPEKRNPYAGVRLARVYTMTHGIDKETVDAVHDYWVAKRQKRGDVPLLKQFDPTVIMLNRPVVKHHPKHTNDKLGLKKLYRLRYDFERTRNIFEILRQREATKLAIVKDQEAYYDISTRTELQRNLMNVLRSLQQLDRNGFFQRPVTVLDAPDYFEVIQYPMDYSVMENKVNRSIYHNWEEFAHDFHLICANAITYNAPETVFAKQAHSMYQRGLTILVRKFGAAPVRSLLPETLQPITRRNTSSFAAVYPPPLELTMYTDEEEDNSDNDDDDDDDDNDGPHLRETRGTRTSLFQDEFPYDGLERRSSKRSKKKSKHQEGKRPRGRPRKYPIPSLSPADDGEGSNPTEKKPQQNKPVIDSAADDGAAAADATAVKKDDDTEDMTAVKPQAKKRKTERIKPVHYVIYEDVDLEAEAAEAERQKERKRKITGCLKELGVAPDEVDTEAPRSMRSRHHETSGQFSTLEQGTLPARRRNCPPKRFDDE